MTLFAAELIVHVLPFATQKPIPTSHSHQNTAVGCISYPQDASSLTDRQKATASAETRPTHLLSSGLKETHLMEEGKYGESPSFSKYMFSKGHGDKPDTVTCTRWIKKLINLGDIEKAVRLMEMLEKYGEPDIFAYITLISGLCRVNRMDLTDKAFEKMITRGLEPEAVLCTRMIQGFF
ncbi:hypothetical protein SLE2022_128020 [Rubroshorea leprosula]